VVIGPGSGEVRPEPLGLSLVISAFNYPLYVGLPYVAVNIAAGNCVILKPSEKAPACSKVMAELFK